MRATDVLKRDHREVEGLFERVEQQEGAERRQAAEALFRELRAHTEAEEQVFYPAIRDAAGDEIVAESIEEHHVVDVLMEEMEAIQDWDSDEWVAKLTVMKENVEHHVEEEEDDMFPDVEEQLGEARLDELGGEIDRFERRHRFEQLTVEELRRAAADADLDGRSDMTKDELVSALCDADVAAPA